MIRIINLRNYNLKENEILFKVDRTSLVGNPFYMSSESYRDKVCDEYINYFNNVLLKNKTQMDYINKIIEIAKIQDVALGCWCYPKRCHAETIKNYIEQLL